MNCDWELSHTFIAKRVGDRGVGTWKGEGPGDRVGTGAGVVERSQIWHLQSYQRSGPIPLPGHAL